MNMQTSLFEPVNTLAPHNLLNKEGCAHYFDQVFSPANCISLFEELLEGLNWQPDCITMFGKQIITKRQVVWVGDAGCSYTYSGQKKYPQAWTPPLLLIKEKLEKLASWQFNSCLLNLYHNGNEAMGWHSDNEKSITPASAIASLSFGAERKFSFRHRLSKETRSVMLEHGSLLLMKGTTQTHWQHSLPKSTRVTSARINLTFRHMVDQ